MRSGRDKHAQKGDFRGKLCVYTCETVRIAMYSLRSEENAHKDALLHAHIDAYLHAHIDACLHAHIDACLHAHIDACRETTKASYVLEEKHTFLSLVPRRWEMHARPG